MKANSLWLLACLTSCAPCMGQEFSMRLSDVPSQVLQGEPISVTLEIRNSSRREIAIARGMNGFDWQMAVYNSDGTPRVCSQLMESGTPIPGNIREVLAPDWRLVVSRELACQDKPGKLLVEAVLRSEGNYFTLEPDGTKRPFQAWKGQASSGKVEILVVPPTGRDLEAYSTMKGCPLCDKQLLAEKFPTSTYTGYALLGQNQCIPDPRVYLSNLLVCDQNAQRWPQTREQMMRDKQRGLKESQERIVLLRSYLKARPDFARADWLKVELAGHLAATQCFQEAEATCDDIISRDPDGVAAQKVRLLKTFLAENGYLTSKSAK